jgi:hypothetical protein
MLNIQRYIGGLICVLSACAHALAQDPQSVDKPVPKVGDSHIYSVLDPVSLVEKAVQELVITEVTDQFIKVMDKTAGKETETLRDLDWATLQAGGRQYTPPIRALAFPLVVGKKWEHTNTSTHPTCGNNTADLKSEVVGWEDVTVPAGTFRTIRIDSQGYWSSRCGRDRLAYKFWYSPDVRWLVKSEATTYAGGKLYDQQIRTLKSFKVQ